MPLFDTVVDYKDSDGGHIRYNRFEAKDREEAFYMAEDWHEVSPAARDVWDVEIIVCLATENDKEDVDYDLEDEMVMSDD